MPNVRPSLLDTGRLDTGIIVITTQFIVSVFLFALAAAITPGPNNVMLMSSGVNFGFRRSVPLLLGVCIGFPAMFLAIGFGLGTVFQQSPQLHEIISIIGIVYLLYLAWRIARSGEPERARDIKPLTFLQSAAFQWVNPKAWVMATGAIAAFTTIEGNIYLQVINLALIFITAAVPSALTWLFFGLGLQAMLSDPKRLRQFNYVMAGLLVLSMVPVIMDLLE
ncbi:MULTISPECIES: LysE family translocator [unclassified Pseudohongiella]|uniref:LysE family translocator n=1 Tax=unclassified Pseudohongiella TaxID=2629611 RepID=UPI002950066A|nr:MULTISPECIES: LysE family translocator [unclassified Pseudohongiella]